MMAETSILTRCQRKQNFLLISLHCKLCFCLPVDPVLATDTIEPIHTRLGPQALGACMAMLYKPAQGAQGVPPEAISKPEQLVIPKH